MYCLNCGNKLEDGSSFCTECGAPVTDTASQAPGTTNASDQATRPIAAADPATQPMNAVGGAGSAVSPYAGAVNPAGAPQRVNSKSTIGKSPVAIALMILGAVIVVAVLIFVAFAMMTPGSDEVTGSDSAASIAQEAGAEASNSENGGSANKEDQTAGSESSASDSDSAVSAEASNSASPSSGANEAGASSARPNGEDPTKESESNYYKNKASSQDVHSGTIYTSGPGIVNSALPGLTSAEFTMPFYGVGVGSFKDYNNAYNAFQDLYASGKTARIIYTPDWSNLNPEPWYSVSLGTYWSEANAQLALSNAKTVNADAYIKYSGSYQG